MKMRSWRPVTILLTVLVLQSSPATAEKMPNFAQSRLAIETGAGRHVFQVEIARTPQQLSFGLMYRRRLPADAGMLFDYHPPQPVAMWMKNTFIPLDMLFIAADGRITRIAARTVPHSLDVIASKKPVRAVLELNAGTASRLGIKTGDVVRHEIFESR